MVSTLNLLRDYARLIRGNIHEKWYDEDKDIEGTTKESEHSHSDDFENCSLASGLYCPLFR